MAVPVSLDDAKRQLKIELDDISQDDEIIGFINAAVAWVEDYTGHVLVSRDVSAVFSDFGTISFREWPIAATVNPDVTYVNANGETVVIVGVRMNVSRRPARAVPSVGGRWPSVPPGTVISATVRAGYGDNDRVPGIFRQAMLIMIAAYDADREGGKIFREADEAARTLCSDYRLRLL